MCKYWWTLGVYLWYSHVGTLDHVVDRKMEFKMKKLKSNIGPKIPDIYKQLSSLLDKDLFKTSEEIIDQYQTHFSDSWKFLVKEYGDRNESPGTGKRKKHYAASVYVADRLSGLKKMGYVELRHTLDFDPIKWPGLKRMGTWRLIKELSQDMSTGKTQVLSIRINENIYGKLAELAKKQGMSIAGFSAKTLTYSLE